MGTKDIKVTLISLPVPGQVLKMSVVFVVKPEQA